MLAQTLIGLLGLMAVQAAKPKTVAVASSRLPVAKYQASFVAMPVLKEAENVGVEVTARAAVIMDAASGKFLFEKNADESVPVASITKLVTAMVVLDAKPNLDDVIEVLPEDEDEETRGIIADNEKMTKRELLHAMLIGSVNKAANTFARVTGGKEAFVRAMNEKARALRLRGANFAEPSGINAENRASAREVAMVLRAALAYPEIRDITSQSSFNAVGRVSGKSYDIKSTDLLLSSYLNHDPYQILAGKTGSLPQAGFCLALATRFEKSHDVIAVALGSENHFARFQDVKALTTWAFASYQWPDRSLVLTGSR